LTKDPWRSSQLCLYMRTLQQAHMQTCLRSSFQVVRPAAIFIVISCACQPSQKCSSRCIYCHKLVPISFHPSMLCQCIARGKAFFFFLGRWISPKKKTKTGVFLLADSTLRTSNEFVYLGLCPDHGYPAITSWQNSLIPFCRSVEALFPYLRCGDWNL